MSVWNDLIALTYEPKGKPKGLRLVDVITHPPHKLFSLWQHHYKDDEKEQKKFLLNMMYDCHCNAQQQPSIY